jgi:uncharacterized phiE125 gp8 family phage protein
MRVLQLTSSPSPVSDDDVKTSLRIDGADFTYVLPPIIAAATEMVEAETRQQLAPATFRLLLDEWPEGRELPLPKANPLVSVASVKYVTGGSLTTLSASAYTVDPSGCMGGRITLNGGQGWPATDDVANAVQVEFTAGYATAAQVPPVLKTCVSMLAGHLLEHPEAVIDRRLDEVPLGVRRLMDLHQWPEAV